MTEAQGASRAQGYFAAGRDGWALKWAGEGGRCAPGAILQDSHWTAGLAAWRLKKFDTAAGLFRGRGGDFREDGSSWLTAAGRLLGGARASG